MKKLVVLKYIRFHITVVIYCYLERKYGKTLHFPPTTFLALK